MLPNMSAQAEIFVERLHNVLAAPLASLLVVPWADPVTETFPSSA